MRLNVVNVVTGVKNKSGIVHTNVSVAIYANCYPFGVSHHGHHLCFPVCTEPTWPTNGVALTSGLHYNASVHFRCFSRYLVSGPSIGWCLANGSWSIPTPLCRTGKTITVHNWTGNLFINFYFSIFNGLSYITTYLGKHCHV